MNEGNFSGSYGFMFFFWKKQRFSKDYILYIWFRKLFLNAY